MNAEIETLEEEKRLLQAKRSEEQAILVNDEELNPYVDDLQETLFKGSISEKKGFLRSFIKEISIDYPTLEIEYILPLAPDPDGGAPACPAGASLPARFFVLTKMVAPRGVEPLSLP